MKIFQIIQSNFKVLGITPSQSSQDGIANILPTLIWCVLSTASYILWFSYTANGFNDYMDAGLFTFESFICTVGLLVLFWNRDQWFQFIGNLEIILNKRELNLRLNTFHVQINSLCIAGSINHLSKINYEEINQKIEKWCKIIDLVTVKVSPFTVVIPKLIISFSKYFATELGNDAFELPNPMW